MERRCFLALFRRAAQPYDYDRSDTDLHLTFQSFSSSQQHPLISLLHRSACTMDFQRALPYELWELIIRELPRSDQRTCLLVSRITHDVARPFIFSRLMIFFGKWEFATDPTDLGYTTWSHRDVDAARHNWTSMDLLRHITRTPEFADLVREVTVAAYSIGNFIEVSGRFLRVLSRPRCANHMRAQHV